MAKLKSTTKLLLQSSQLRKSISPKYRTTFAKEIRSERSKVGGKTHRLATIRGLAKSNVHRSTPVGAEVRSQIGLKPLKYR
jgi:hypothetical protein